MAITNKEEQSKIWQTQWATVDSFHSHWEFRALKKITQFNFETMYDFWFMNKNDSTSANDNNIVDARNYQLHSLGYLLVDVLPRDHEDQRSNPSWVCGLLAHDHYNYITRRDENTQRDYVRHKDEMLGYIRINWVEFYDSNDIAQRDELNMQDLESTMLVHLDIDFGQNIDYFGSQTTIKQQKDFLHMIIKYFGGVNKSLALKLEKIL